MTRRIETALEVTASVREDPLERPSGGLVGWQQGVDEEAHGMVAGAGGDDTGHGVGTGRIAGRNLPDLPDALEAADVEGVDTDELSRLAGLDVSPLSRSCRWRRVPPTHYVIGSGFYSSGPTGIQPVSWGQIKDQRFCFRPARASVS